MKTHLDWLELTSLAADPTDTDTKKRGICVVDDTLKFWDGTQWVAVGELTVDTFIELTDTPASFTDTGDFIVKVNTSADALEFVEVTGDVTMGADGKFTLAEGVELTKPELDEAELTEPVIINPIVTNTVKTVSTAHTVTAGEDVILASGTTTVTLPAVAENTGMIVTIRNVGENTVTIAAAGSEEIEGEASGTLATKEFATIVCDGTAWFVISGEITFSE